MRFARACLACSVLALAAPASASDLCFSDDLVPGATFYVFKKLKLPKQPLDALPVAGTLNGTLGVIGTSFRTAGGGLHLSLVGAGCFVEVDLGANFTGSAHYDCSGTPHQTTWTPVDCSAL